jgi:hypothetical protein
MILQVPFEQFATTVKRVLTVNEVFVTPRGNTTLATAASSDRKTMVVSVTSLTISEARMRLEPFSLDVFDGAWHTEGVLDIETQTSTPFVAAVAYVAQGHAPGLWVDAFETLPTQMTVLKSMFDEFRQTGQLEDVSFEEFVRLAQPTVVISTPDELHSYVGQKNC